MLLIVGLGNPGKEYEFNRHNVGFICLNQLAKDLGANFKKSTKHKAEIAISAHSGQKIVMIKPDTYMNLSGEAVLLIKQFYKVEIDDIIVIHDDIDLDFADLRFKCGGGHAGHNGLRSIDKLVGNYYHRIRIGVSRPQNQQEVSSYVLANFTISELDIINKLSLLLSNNISNLIAKNWQSIKEVK